MSTRIAIIGAGVSGLAFATLAARQGHKVEVFERRSQAGSELGAGVTLWPNAIFVLQQIGLLNEVQKVAGAPMSMRRFDLTSGVQDELSLQGLHQAAGFPTLTILRRDLMAILFSAAQQAGVPIHFSNTVNLETLAQLEQKYDWVVGADGRMNSMVRQMVSPASQPIYQGFVNVIGISRANSARFFKSDAIQDFWGDGERFGIVPINNTQCFWAAGWAEPQFERNRTFSLAELVARFATWPDGVLAVLKQAQSNSLNTVYVHDLDPMDSWYRKPYLVIGDAAHAALPTSGQGACQALEDAWWLATLMEEEEMIDNAFERFQAKRVEKTAAIQMTGRHIAQAIFHTPPHQRPTQANLTQASMDALAAFWMSGLTR